MKIIFIFSCSGMFRNVSECSGMFHVPGFIDAQINLLAKGLKFIPTPVTKQTQIRQQLLRDFDQIARRIKNLKKKHKKDK